jgi:hypothetical protein
VPNTAKVHSREPSEVADHTDTTLGLCFTFLEVHQNSLETLQPHVVSSLVCRGEGTKRTFESIGIPNVALGSKTYVSR